MLFGTAAPLTVFAANAHPTWVGLCQVRTDSDGNGKYEARAGAHGELEGDRLTALLVDFAGKETPLDQFLGSDPSGRYVAFTQAGQLWLRDAQSNVQQKLREWTANKVTVRGSGAWPPSSFDGLGRYFAYLEQKEGAERVVLRDLATGTERFIDPGAGRVWTLQFEPDAALLRIDMVLQDNNGNGRLDGPLAAYPNPTCRAPVPNYAIRRYQADALHTKVYDLETSALRDVQNFVASIGKRVITRGPDRELRIESAPNASVVISAPSCNGRILHIDSERDAIVLGCAKASGERRGLYLRHSDKLLNLKLDVAAFETDARLAPEQHWLPISTSTESTLVDLGTGQVQRLTADTLWLAAYADTALAERAGRLWLISGADNAKVAAEQDTQRKRPRLAALRCNGPLVALGSELYDLQNKRFVGSFSDVPLVLAPNGEGLVARESANAPHFASGPLHWELPHPAPTPDVGKPSQP